MFGLFVLSVPENQFVPAGWQWMNSCQVGMHDLDKFLGGYFCGGRIFRVDQMEADMVLDDLSNKAVQSAATGGRLL